MEVTPRAGLLDEAREIISKDRSNAYGEPEDNFQRIADLWTAAGFTHNGNPVSSWAVAIALDLLKTARIVNNPTHRDSWVDKAGYTGCGWQAVERGNHAESSPVE